MKKYGEIAVEATKIVELLSVSPEDAWTRAAQEVYPNNLELQENTYPKQAYLELCENGNVRGVPQGRYTQSRSKNSSALRALLYLRWKNNNESVSPDELWEKLDTGVEHNSQMNVVLSLVGSGYMDV